MKFFRIFLLAAAIILVTNCTQSQTTLFTDQFDKYEVGPFFPHVGPHTEYHYISAAQPTGPWVMSAFASRWMDTAWRVNLRDGAKIMSQTVESKTKHTHPMLVAGDNLWSEYRVEVTFSPSAVRDRAGVMFRYENDRCYYYFGMQDDQVAFIKVQYERDFHMPQEDTLAIASFDWKAGKKYTLAVDASLDKFAGYVDGNKVLTASDKRYITGKIGILADAPADFYGVMVTGPAAEKRRVEEENKRINAREVLLQEENPKMALWKKFDTPVWGTGRNVRFGDLDGDGQPDALFGQIQQHAYPLDRFSELSCLTAVTFDGKILWQTGTPDPEKYELTNDVAFQIFDIDRDGHNEVIYTMNSTIYVADGATGKIKYQAPTPAKKATMYFMDDKSKPMRDFDRILGDCLFICDLRGVGYPQDIVIKDRYETFWVLDETLKIRWQGDCKTGHYPYAYDLDSDGADELLIGYSAYKGDGSLLWSWDTEIEDHCDGIAAVDLSGGEGEPRVRVLAAASDEGFLIANVDGEIIKHDRIGHAQNPAVANLRPDLPGLETVVIDFWGSQGIMHFYDAQGNIYLMIEPTNYGSMCLPINWRGDGQEFIVLNPNVKEGGMYDGWGRRAVVFPDDGHPDMCNAVLDITGDVRDEVVVWDMHSMWVYTQSDSPKTGRLYTPVRNPLWNYSNYQLTVSSPGWVTAEP